MLSQRRKKKPKPRGSNGSIRRTQEGIDKKKKNKGWSSERAKRIGDIKDMKKKKKNCLILRLFFNKRA